MKKSGFTLIELIFVIVIIGLLAAVAVPKFLATKKNAETANMPEIAKQITNKAEEKYEFLGEHNLTKIVAENSELNRTTEDFQKRPDKWLVQKSADDYNISYKGDTTTNVCLAIHVVKKDVNVSPISMVKTYEFNTTELNTSCNTQ